MKIYLGEQGLDKSHQALFPSTINCCYCKGVGRIAFVAHENGTEENQICDLHANNGKGEYWLHDVCSVAVYLCKNCLKATAKINQG